MNPNQATNNRNSTSKEHGMTARTPRAEPQPSTKFQEIVAGGSQVIARRTFFKATLGILGGVGLARHMPFAAYAAAAASSATRRPNIIFILTDDQGYGDLSCHGNPILKTPKIDTLYAESTRFTDFQVSPVCSPTRCALMTGRFEFRSGVHDTRGPGQNMSLKATTVAQVLKSAGYSTGLFGKWHLGEEKEYQPWQRGFDESLSFLSGMIAEGMPGNNKDKTDCILLRNGEKEKTDGWCTDVFFGEAIKWMGKVKGDGPFFAYIPTSSPHAPVKSPPEYSKPYMDKVPGSNNREMPDYYGEIANIDENVGKLMEQLKAWKIQDNTMLVFMSDNGAPDKGKNDISPVKSFNAGMKGHKGTVDEGGTRVPSFWYWPGVFSGGKNVGKLAAHIDVFPTFAEIAGAKAPQGLELDGRSLLPLLKDPDAAWPDRFICVHKSGSGAKEKGDGFAVRNDRFRMVGNGALFDVKADRGQTKNIISEHKGVATEMRAAYDQWWDSVRPGLGETTAAASEEKPDKNAKQKKKQGQQGQSLDKLIETEQAAAANP
ncbi:MAG: arylsulfatase [Phycisphaeraceae bacterium]